MNDRLPPSTNCSAGRSARGDRPDRSGFTDNLYELERFEEVLAIAADIRNHVVGGSIHSGRSRNGSIGSVPVSLAM